MNLSLKYPYSCFTNIRQPSCNFSFMFPLCDKIFFTGLISYVGNALRRDRQAKTSPWNTHIRVNIHVSKTPGLNTKIFKGWRMVTK